MAAGCILSRTRESKIEIPDIFDDGEGAKAGTPVLRHLGGLKMLKPSRILLAALAAMLCEAAVFAQAPTITAGAVVNAASLKPGLSPGSLASIFGQNLSTSDFCLPTALPLPTTLCGAQVSVGGKSAALDYASPTQLTVQIPVDVAPGSAQLTVTVQGKGSASFTDPRFLLAGGLHARHVWAESRPYPARVRFLPCERAKTRPTGRDAGPLCRWPWTNHPPRADGRGAFDLRRNRYAADH